MAEKTQDVELFELVHALLEESRGYQLGERREQPRNKYDCVQLIAPYDGEQLPTQADFRRVHCRDLAKGGFSFFAEQAPETEQMVVALGAVPFSFFIADVVRVKQADVDLTGSYLVGCRFIERVTATAGGKPSGA